MVAKILYQIYATTHKLPTIMQESVKERTVIQRVLDTLPSGHTVIRDAHQILTSQGHTISRRGLYEVVKGRSKKPDLIAAILDAAEAFKTRTAELAARAEKLAQS
jgi:hypothetical protein